jgi:BASS family bile acid:Na+ symporter
MEAFQALFNTVLIIFIVATMLSAGFSTTFEQVKATFQNIWVVVLALVVAFIVRPLVGWGTAEVLALAVPAFIAMALLWSCPGAPFGAKLVMTAKADVQRGAVLQVLLALIGSITFAPTANAIISAADLGADVSLPVADLIKTVAVLQLTPFVLGMLTRHWAPERAMEWNGFSLKASNLTFVGVLAGALLGSWQTIVDLIGSRTVLAALIASAVVLVVGYLASPGAKPTKRAAALIQPGTNAGPAFAAVAIAFDNDPEVLGAITAILLSQIVIGVLAAVYFARGHSDADSASHTATA